MASLDRSRLREKLEETLQRSREDSDRQMDALLAEVRGIQTWIQDTFDQLEMLSVTLEDDDCPRGVSDVTNHRQHLQRLQHTIREHKIPVQVALQKGKRHVDREPDAALQTDLKNIQYFWDLLQGRVAGLQELLGEGSAPPPLGNAQPHTGVEGGTMCDNRRTGRDQDNRFPKSPNFRKPSHRRIVERSTQGLIAAVEKLQRRTDELTSPGDSPQMTLGTTTLATMNQSNPISISHGGCRPDNLLTRELSSSDESLNELMIDVNEYMASLVELENSCLDDDGYGSFGKKGLGFYNGSGSAENSAQESPRVTNRGACGFSSEDELDEAVSSLEDLHMSWECLSSSPPNSLPVFYRLPQPKHSTPRAEGQDKPQEGSQVSSKTPGEEEKGDEGKKENMKEGKSVREEEMTVNAQPLTFEVTESLPEAIKEQFEQNLLTQAFSEDLKMLSEFLENMTEQAASFQTPGEDLVGLQVFLEKHLAFKMQIDTNAVLRSAVVKEGRHLAGSLGTQRAALEAVLHTIEQRWAQLVRAVHQQHCAISLALESFRMDLTAPRGEGADGEDLKEAVAMETAQDAMEEMSLKLSGSGVSDTPTDIKVNSVVRFHMEELAEESWDLLSSSPEDSLLLSPHGSPPGAGAHSYELADFTQQHQELAEWLGEIDGVLTDRDDLMMSEEQIKHLCKAPPLVTRSPSWLRWCGAGGSQCAVVVLTGSQPGFGGDLTPQRLSAAEIHPANMAALQSYEIEMGLYQRRRDTFLQKGERLKAAYPDLFSDISDKLLAITKKWDLLRVNLAHEGGITPPGENEMVLAALEASIEHLQAWLSDMEAKMFVNDIYNISGVEDLEVRLKQHEALQLDIEAHAPSIASVLELCEKLEDDCQACRTFEEKEALQLAAINLERRWDAICMQAIDMQCRLEERLCTYRQGLYQTKVGRYDLSSSASTLSEVATGSTDTSLDLEDFPSDADVIPFDAGEYESIVHGSAEFRKTRRKASSHNNFETETRREKQKGEKGLSHSDGDVRPKRRTLKKYTDQRHSTCSLNPYSDDSLFSRTRRSTSDIGPQKSRKQSSKELYFNKQTSQSTSVASAIVTLDSEVLLDKDKDDVRDDNLFATIKGVLVDRTMSLDEGLNVLGVVEIHTVPQALSLSKRELFSRIAGHLMSSALLTTQSDSDLLKEGASRVGFPLVASDKLEAGAFGAEFDAQEEERYHSRESGISSDQEALLMSLEEDRLKEQQDELEEDPGWYHSRDAESGSNPEFTRTSVHKERAVARERAHKSPEHDSSAAVSAQGYRKYGLSDRTLEILQEVMDTTSPFVSKLRQTNGRGNDSTRCCEQEEYDEREDSVDVASLLLNCYDEENAADSMEWDSGMSSYECTPLSTFGFGEEDQRRSDGKGGKSGRRRKQESREEESSEDASSALFATTDDCPAEYAVQEFDLGEPDCTADNKTDDFLAEEQCKRSEEDRKYFLGRHGNGLLGNELASCKSRVSGTLDTTQQGGDGYSFAGSTRGEGSSLHSHAGTLSTRRWQLHEEEMTSSDVLWHRRDGPGIRQLHPSASLIGDVDYRGPKSGVPTSPDKHSGHGSGAPEFITAPGDNGYHTEAARRVSFVTGATGQPGGWSDRGTSAGSGDSDSDGRMTNGADGNGSTQCHRPLVTTKHLQECETGGIVTSRDAGMVTQNVYNRATEVVTRGDKLDQFASGYVHADGSGTGGTRDGDAGNGHEVLSNSSSSSSCGPEADLRLGAGPADSGDVPDSAISGWDGGQASSGRSIPYHSSNTLRTQEGILGNHRPDSPAAKFEDDEMFRRFQSLERELLAEDDFLALPPYSRRFGVDLIDVEEDDAPLKEEDRFWYPPSGTDSDLELLDKRTYKQIDDLASSGAILEETTKSLKELLNGFGGQRPALDASGSDSDASTVKEPNETTLSGSKTFLSGGEHDLNEDASSGPNFEKRTSSLQTRVLEEEEDFVSQQIITNSAHVEEQHETLNGSSQPNSPPIVMTEESQADNSNFINNKSWDVTGTKVSVDEQVPCAIPDKEIETIKPSDTEYMGPANYTDDRHDSKPSSKPDLAISDPGCFGRRRIVPRKIPLGRFASPIATHLANGTCANQRQVEVVQDHRCLHSADKPLPLQQNGHETNGVPQHEMAKETETLCNGGHESLADAEKSLSPPSYDQACGEVQVEGLQQSKEDGQSTRGAEWWVDSSSVVSGTSEEEEQLSCSSGQTGAFQSAVHSIGVQQEDYSSSYSTSDGVNNTQTNHSVHTGVSATSDVELVMSELTDELELTEQITTSNTFAAEAQLKVTSEYSSSVSVDSEVCDDQFTAEDSSQLVLHPASLEEDGPLVGDTLQGERESSSTAFSATSEVDGRPAPSGLTQTTTQQILHGGRAGSVTTTDSSSTNWVNCCNTSQIPNQQSVPSIYHQVTDSCQSKGPQADPESIQAGSDSWTSGPSEDGSRLKLLCEEDGKRSSSHSQHPNGTLPGGEATAQCRTGSSSQTGVSSHTLEVKEHQEYFSEQSDGSNSNAANLREPSHESLQACDSQGKDESAVEYGRETNSGHSRHRSEEGSSQSDAPCSAEGARTSQGADLDNQSGEVMEGTVSYTKKSLTVVHTLQSSHRTESSSYSSQTQRLTGTSLGPSDGTLPPQVGCNGAEPDDLLLALQHRSRSTEADASTGGVAHAEPPTPHAEPPCPHAEPLIRRRKPERTVQPTHRQPTAKHMASRRSPDGRAPLEADQEETRSWPRLGRVLRLALPVQALLFLLLLLVGLLPLMLEPECCTTANNLHRSIHPTLRHVNGPSPT
ncbi:AKAP6 [Branchiostoma lanceolatum]|uniref:AKAP6 protein n=1 Tax=Branchiostoma lanceolatum TaxID=7740 RepID=A0A8J9ZSL8_BRALA|nr:AKAP6 [Branchiostoma lanceolatum]